MYDLNFVEITPEDINDLQNTARTIWIKCYSDILPPEQIEYMLEMMYSLKTIQREIQKENINYFYIFLGNQKIGFFSLGPYNDLRGRAKLHKIYLLPEFQSKGLGSASLVKICDLASESGYDSICLNVNKNNSQAIKAYERNGFVNTEAVINDIGNGYVMDDYVMVKDLSH
jgi:RimJ/RimL family protein N-acetyltransferase